MSEVVRGQSKWNSLFKQLLVIVCYLALFGAIHLISISLVVFFHFQLDHDLKTIDSWIQSEAWKIFIFVKLVQILIISKFIFVYLKEKNLLSFFRLRVLKKPQNEVFAIVIMFYVLILGVGQPALIEEGSWGFNRIFWAYSGTLFLYLTDITFFLSLQKVIFVDFKQRIFILTLFSFATYYLYRITIDYADGFNLSFLLIFLFLLFLSSHQRFNLIDSLLVLLACFCILAPLIGLDPIWADSFSLFSIESNTLYLILISTICTSLVYLFFTRHHRIKSP